jgi:hypothetical protein
MADDLRPVGKNTLEYYHFFQILYDAADATSLFWQPILKSVGRTQLEFAGLQAKQGQAVLHWAQQMMQPHPLPDIVRLNAELWSALTGQYMTVLPRVAAAAAAASAIVTPTVLPLPKRRHDTLILLDRDDNASAGERRVA